MARSDKAETRAEGAARRKAARLASKSTAQGQAERKTTREQFQERYDLDPLETFVDIKHDKRRAEHLAVAAAGHDIDLGGEVFGAFMASGTFYTRTVPTLRAIVVALETNVARAARDDAKASKLAAIEHFKTHPDTWVMPEATLPAAELALEEAKAKLAAAINGQNETYRMGLAAMKVTKIGKSLKRAWAEGAHPELTDEMTRGAAAEAEGKASDLVIVIEQLYTLHLGGVGERKDRKLLRQLFAARPAEMPTIEEVWKTTRAVEAAAQERAAKDAETRQAKRQDIRDDAANAAARRVARKPEAEVTTT